MLLLRRKKPAFDDLETPGPIQTVCSGKGAKAVARQTFTEDIRRMTHRFNQQKPGIKTGLSKKDLQRALGLTT